MGTRTLVGWVLVALVLGWAGVSRAQVTFSNPTPIIMTPGGGSPYPSPITVSSSASISRIEVTLHGVTHQDVASLGALLVSPGGQRIQLFRFVGEEGPRAGLTLVFTSETTAPLMDPTEPMASGVYVPSVYGMPATMPAPAPPGPYGTSLVSLLGTPMGGTWQLFITDLFSESGGVMAGGWSLTFNGPAAAPISPTISYQGRLTDASGAAFDGSADVRFTLWDSASGGFSPRQTRTITGVDVDQGLFSTAVAGLGALEEGRPFWLGVEVAAPSGSAFHALTPRQPLLTAPRAVRASVAGVAESLVPRGPTFLSGQSIFLRGLGDANHGVRYAGPTSTFAGFAPDGPAVFGFGGGVLGSAGGTPRIALRWDSSGRVGIGTNDPLSTLHVVGETRTTSLRFADGTTQTTAREILHQAVTIDLPSIGGGGSMTAGVSLAGVVAGDAVIVNPQASLPAGIIIGWARAKGANTIELSFSNITGAVINPPAIIFDVTAVR